MSVSDDYQWKLRNLDWFNKVVGKRIEYASLALIKQVDKKGMIPSDVIHGVNDAEYHYRLGREWEYYYRIKIGL